MGKGLNHFSALSIGAPQASTSADTTRSSPSISNSGSGEGSGGTVGIPSTPSESVLPPLSSQEPSTRGGSNFTFPMDVETSIAQLLARNTALPPVTSYTAPSSNFKVPSTTSGSTYATSNWRSDQSVPPPATPTSFTPPTAPSSFSGSAISSVKPSSSISARMELSRKRKADGDDQSMASTSLSATAPSSTSSARKRCAGNPELIRVGNELGGLRDDISSRFNTFEHAMTDLSARATSRNVQARADTPTPLVHPSIHLARQKLLLIDSNNVSQADIAKLFAHFQQDASFTDGYLQLAEDPDGFAVARQQWLQQGIETMARRQ